MSEISSVGEPLKDDGSIGAPTVQPQASQRFFNSAREQVLQRAAHLCRYGEQLLVVVADNDQGKSYFLEQLVNDLKVSTRSVVVKSRESDSAVEVLSQVLELLIGEPVETEDNSIGALLARIRVCLSQDSMGSPVVIIDDANWLTDEVLSMVLSLLTSGFESSPLKVVMAGNQELVARLDRLGGIEAMIYDLELPLPTASEWLAYADELGASSAIDEEGIEQIIKANQNRYSRIIEDIEQRVFSSIAEPEASSRLGLPPLHLAAGVVLLALLLGIFVFGDWLWSSDSQTANADVPNDIVVVDAGSVASGSSESTQYLNSDVALAPAIDPGAIEEDIEASLVVNSGESESSNPQGQENNAKAIVSAPVDNAEPKSIPELKSSPESSRVAVDEQKQSSAGDNNLPLEASSEAPVSTESASVQSVSNASSFLARPDSNYVLQIMAARNKETLEQFRRIQSNRASIELVALKRNNQDWFVLLQGNYSNAQQARNAIETLPEIQKKDGVWPRSVGEIKRSITAN